MQNSGLGEPVRRRILRRSEHLDFRAAAQSDPTIGVLPSYNDVYTNWSNAGLQSVGGIPTRTTVCATVNPTGVTPPTSADDAVAINNAITACAAGDVVQLAAGTFQIAQSEYIALNRA